MRQASFIFKTKGQKTAKVFPGATAIFLETQPDVKGKDAPTKGGLKGLL